MVSLPRLSPVTNMSDSGSDPGVCHAADGRVDRLQLRRREVSCVVQGRQTAWTCLHLTAHEGSQGIVCRLVGAVNLRQVEVRSDAVDVLGRIARTRAGRRISVGSGKCQGDVVWPADRVAHWNGDGHRGTVVESQIHVVIHELTEGVGELPTAIAG